MNLSWVLLGAFVLSFLGGCINVMMLGIFHVPVSHMSGAFSHLSMASGAGIDFKNLSFSVGIIGSFFVGAVLSGILIKKENLLPSNPYATTLLIEALLLVLAHRWIMNHDLKGLFFAGAACGIQNGMASTYLGLNIRTTHVTGSVTDLALLTGRFLRGEPPNPSQIILLSLLLIGFLVGGIVAAILLNFWGIQSIILPSILVFMTAISFMVLQKKGAL